MSSIRRVIFTLVALAIFFHASVSPAEAAAWHSGVNYWDGIGDMCLNGVEVHLVDSSGDIDQDMNYIAYMTSDPYPLTETTLQDGPPPANTGDLDSVRLVATRHHQPFDAQGFTVPFDYFGYDSARLSWNLSYGQVVVVLPLNPSTQNPQSSYFIGPVEDCTL